jgi:hypothetical protein
MGSFLLQNNSGCVLWYLSFFTDASLYIT